MTLTLYYYLYIYLLSQEYFIFILQIQKIAQKKSRYKQLISSSRLLITYTVDLYIYIYIIPCNNNKNNIFFSKISKIITITIIEQFLYAYKKVVLYACKKFFFYNISKNDRN